MATTWAQRLKRVFGIDIYTCPAFGGAVRIVASIEDPVVIEKISSLGPYPVHPCTTPVTYLDAKAVEPQTSRRPPCRAPPQRGLLD